MISHFSFLRHKFEWFHQYGNQFFLALIWFIVWLIHQTHPDPEMLSGFHHPIFISISVGIPLILILSFQIDIIQKHLYDFTLLIFVLIGVDFWGNLYSSHFAQIIKIGFLLYIIVIPWYLQSTRELLLFQLTNTLAVTLVFMISPGLPADEYLFIVVVILINLFTYFIIGIKIQRSVALNQQGFHYRKIIERLNDGVLQLDEDGTIVMVNQKFCNIIGYHSSELVGRMNISSMISKENRRILLKHLKNRKNRQTGQHEIRFVKRDGAVIWLFLSINPEIDSSGQHKGATAIVSDITKRKLAERDLKQYAMDLAYNNKALEDTNVELEQFTQIAATDLKAPLYEIKQTTIKIRDFCSNGQQEKGVALLSSLKANTQRMKDLLDALWQYASSGKGNMKLEKVEVSLLVKEVIGDLLAHNRPITYSQLPALQVDRLQLKLLFYHLLGNAIKFSGEDVDINIHVKIEEENRMAEFCVEDRGAGIPAEFHEHVFLIFQKGPYQEEEGIGLGLPICKKIVHNHDGEIWLESKIEVGTRIYFTLPLAENEVI